MLKSLGHVIEEATSDRAAVRLLERSRVDLVLAGADPNDSDALELLNYVRRKHREIPVILLFSHAHAERTKEAARLGATAILKYPVPAAELRATVMQALESCEGHYRAPAPSQAQTVDSASPQPTARAVMSEPEFHYPEQANGVVREFDTPARQAAMGQPPTPAVPAFTPGQNPRELGHMAADPAPVSIRDRGLIGNDLSLRQIVEMATAIAPSKSPVLIQGEPGTGKSHLARIIWQMGNRTDQPFVVLNCAAFAEATDTSDLSHPNRPSQPLWTAEWTSKMNMARGGTILLEEVASLPAELQLQLLRELQVRDFEAISGQTLLLNDVRFIMTTSESLAALVEQGQFRQELFHRISIVSLTLPPLRHRGADIEQLAEYFRAKFAREYRRDIAGFTRDAIDALHRHEWPGNLRELEGVVQRAVALCNSSRITASHLAPAMHQNRPSRGSLGGKLPRPHLPMGIRPLKEALEEPEKKIIIQALQAFNWNRQETARVLDINRTTLYKKMKKYGLLTDEPIWVN